MTDRTPSVVGSTVEDFAEALASERATPGGGAAAAVAAALGASLTAMVVRLSRDRPKYAEHAALHAEALAKSDASRLALLQLADADATAYAAYREARSLPHDTEAQTAARTPAIQRAARGATQVPLDVVRACHAQIELVDRVAGRTNLYLASDLEVAALLLDGAARSAASNVRVNLGSIDDDAFTSAVSVELDQRLQQIQGSADRARERVAKRTLRRPERE